MGISHLQLICGQNLTEFYSVVLTYAFREHFRATSAATVSTSRGRSRTTIHFRNASENISIVEVRNVAKNAFRCPRRFREPWFADPFREVILLYKPKIKRIHGGFGRCSIVDYLNIFEYERAGHSTARLDIMSGWWYTYPSEKYGLRQLGWWHSQNMESHKFQVPNHQPDVDDNSVLMVIRKVSSISELA